MSCEHTNSSYWSAIATTIVATVIFAIVGNTNALELTSNAPDGQIQQKSVHSFDRKTLIVLSVTLPLGIIIGVLWCYCMSAMLKLRQGDQIKKARLTAPTGDYGNNRRQGRSQGRSRPMPRSHSPTPSTASSI